MLGGDQIKPRLRFAAVGDGRGSHFKIAFGGGQLFGHGFLLRHNEGQAVVGGQHVKVSLADAHHQILLHGIELRFGLFELFLALVKSNLIGRAVQGIGAAQRELLRAETAVGVGSGGRCNGDVRLRSRRRQIGRGAQASAGLLCAVQIGLGLCLGGEVSAIGPFGLVKQLDEALGVQGGREQHQARRRKPGQGGRQPGMGAKGLQVVHESFSHCSVTIESIPTGVTIAARLCINTA